MEGGKTRIYKQNLSRLIRLTDFFGITDSSGLMPLSQIRDNGIINNGRRGEELEKAQAEVRRTTPEKKPSIRERLEDAKRECGSRKGPDKPTQQKKPPELGDL